MQQYYQVFNLQRATVTYHQINELGLNVALDFDSL